MVLSVFVNLQNFLIFAQSSTKIVIFEGIEIRGAIKGRERSGRSLF